MVICWQKLNQNMLLNINLSTLATVGKKKCVCGHTPHGHPNGKWYAFVLLCGEYQHTYTTGRKLKYGIYMSIVVHSFFCLLFLMLNLSNNQSFCITICWCVFCRWSKSTKMSLDFMVQSSKPCVYAVEYWIQALHGKLIFGLVWKCIAGIWDKTVLFCACVTLTSYLLPHCFNMVA